MAGGGLLYDIASHRIDALNFLFGHPARATGLLSNAVQSLKVEDSATVLIDYPRGVRGTADVRVEFAYRARSVRRARRELPAHSNLHFPAIANFVDGVEDPTARACPGEEAIWTDWVTELVRKSESAGAR